MAKLIYSAQKLADFLTSNKNYADSDNTLYRSIAFLSDGNIITHGVIFNATGTASKINVGTGHTGSILYFDSNGDSLLLAAGTSGLVLKHNGTNPYWTTDNNTLYNLTINGTKNGDSSGTNLGSIYAPTTKPTNGLLEYNNGWTSRSIVSNSTGIIADSTSIATAGAIYNYVSTATSGLTSAMHYRGSGTISTDSSGNITVTISGVTSFTSGDIVVDKDSKKEYVYDGSSWRELGDEGSYALKTINIIAGDGLTGGGTLTENRTLSLNKVTRNNTTGTATSLKYGDSLTVVTGVSTDAYGRLTGTTTTKFTLPASDEVNYAGTFYWSSSTTKATANPSSATSNPYLQLILNSQLKTYVQFNAGTGISVNANGNALTIANTALQKLNFKYQGSGQTSASNVFTYTPNGSEQTLTLKAGTNVDIKNTSGVLTISSTNTNTWRNVSAYNLSNSHAEVLSNTIGTADLDFGSEFAWTQSTGDDSNAIHLVWAEYDSSGNVTYAV